MFFLSRLQQNFDVKCGNIKLKIEGPFVSDIRDSVEIECSLNIKNIIIRNTKRA